MNLKKLIKESYRSVLKEYMEVWRDENIMKLAKQIYVDFADSSKIYDTTASKDYHLNIEGTDYTVRVKVSGVQGLDGQYFHHNKLVELYLNHNTKLSTIQRILFHEFTHAKDETREEQLGASYLKKSFYKKNMLYLDNKRQSKLLETLNDLTYYLYDKTEANAWQAKVIDGLDSVKDFLNSIVQMIQSLEKKKYRHDDQAYPIIVKRLFNKDLNYPEAKQYYLKKTWERFDWFKRKLYKNYSQYQYIKNDDLTGITPSDANIANNSNTLLNIYKQFINDNKEAIAKDICKNIGKSIKTRFDGIFSKPFTLSYKFNGTTIKIKIKTWATRSGSYFSGKCYELNPITALSPLEKAYNEYSKLTPEEKLSHYNTGVLKLMQGLERINEE